MSNRCMVGYTRETSGAQGFDSVGRDEERDKRPRRRVQPVNVARGFSSSFFSFATPSLSLSLSLAGSLGRSVGRSVCGEPQIIRINIITSSREPPLRFSHLAPPIGTRATDRFRARSNLSLSLSLSSSLSYLLIRSERKREREWWRVSSGTKHGSIAADTFLYRLGDGG